MATRDGQRKSTFKVQVGKAARWLHIYLSMISFAVVLFFSATGLTLNHQEWFSTAVRTSERHGTIDASLVRTAAATNALIQALRTREHLHGQVEEPRVEDNQISFSYRAPGYTADAVVDRPAGTYTITETRNGFVAVMNDLHKGSDSGKAWSRLIDASAILLTLVSFTGLLILFFIYKRRASGLITAAAGLALVLLVYKIFVP